MTESILRTHLARCGVEPELGTELVSIEQDDGKVVAHVLKRSKDDGHQVESIVEAQYLIGTDGARGPRPCSYLPSCESREVDS